MGGEYYTRAKVDGRWQSVAIPFNEVDGRRYLTKKQVAEHDYIRDFIERFPSVFWYDGLGRVYWLTEPNDS